MEKAAKNGFHSLKCLSLLIQSCMAFNLLACKYICQITGSLDELTFFLDIHVYKGLYDQVIKYKD